MPNLPSENALRAGIATLIVIATSMLGLGVGSATLTLISLVIVATSIYVADVAKWFQFSQPTANWIALGVVIVAAANMLYTDRAGLVIAVANLQSYLQYVLLFQKKTPRVYWQLAVLSLGQVAIASTLMPGPLFGFMLLAYFSVGIATLTILLLRSESARFASAGALLAPAGGPAGSLCLAGVPPTSLAAGKDPTGLGGRLMVQTAAITVVSLVVAATLFFLIPRRPTPNRESPTGDQVRTVGFSKTITLGELGEVVQNPEVVMRIQFFRGHGSIPFQLAAPGLFRGTALTLYEEGSWTHSRRGDIAPLPTDHHGPFVRQRITVEPMDVPELFCVTPVFGLQPDPRLRINPNGEQLWRQEEYRSQQMEFEVGTTGILNDRPREYLPCDWPLRRRVARGELLQMPSRIGDVDPLAGLRDTAIRVLSEKEIDPSDHVAAARALSDYLRYSGQYTYSLLGQSREPDTDPLEDFVTSHRVGHCEYFAGALVMMLRSVKIPARVAIGFKGGEWNPVGRYYQVQQLHAHAWVEVFLEGDEIPPDAFTIDEYRPPAAWLVLDPTVNLQEDNAANAGYNPLTRLRQYVDYAHVLWANYIAGLNAKRQQQGIYAPVVAGVRGGLENLFGADVWRARMRAVASSPVGTFWEWYRRHWFSWRGGLVAAGASMVLVGGYLAARWLLRMLRKLLRVGRVAHQAPTLEMYRRLEAVLARQGLTRDPGQTAHEFAVAAGGHLSESIELHRVSHLPRRVVELFYRVRFGGRTLDNLESHAVEQALTDLERVLGRRR